MDLNGHFIMGANTARYDRDEYSNKVVNKLNRMTQVTIDSKNRSIKEFVFEKHFIESEERWLGDGFFPR